MLGSYDPGLKVFEEWQLPGGSGSRPYGMAMDHREHIWLAEGGNPNRLVEFDTGKQAFDTVIDAPNANGSIRHMYFDRDTKSIWFGEDTNFVGRLQIP
jgi:virginiamycin B lyase